MSAVKLTIADVKLQLVLAGSDKDRLAYWHGRLDVLEARDKRRKGKLKGQRVAAATERKKLKAADQRKLGGLPTPLSRKITKQELAKAELTRREKRKEQLNQAGAAMKAAFEAARKK